MTYDQSRAWSDRFIDQQMQILNNNIAVLDFNKIKPRGYQIAIASQDDDMNLETDMVVFGTLRIALRVRNGYSSTYNDIALRSARPSGAKTEVAKIKEGLGDYYLYCWTQDGHTITEYILIDLDRFRSVMDDCLTNFDWYQCDGTAINTYSIDQMIAKNCCVSSYLLPSFLT